MKKAVISIALILILLLSGCSVRNIEKNDALKYLHVFVDRLKSVIEKQEGWSVTDEYVGMSRLFSNRDGTVYYDRKAQLTVENNLDRIDIEIYYNASYHCLYFDVSYFLDSVETGTFDTDFYAKLVGVLCEKRITPETCKEFIEAPEEKYPITNTRAPDGSVREKKEEEKIVKIKYVGPMFRAWGFEQVVKTDGSTVLSFGGQAKTIFFVFGKAIGFVEMGLASLFIVGIAVVVVVIQKTRHRKKTGNTGDGNTGDGSM